MSAENTHFGSVLRPPKATSGAFRSCTARRGGGGSHEARRGAVSLCLAAAACRRGSIGLLPWGILSHYNVFSRRYYCYYTRNILSNPYGVPQIICGYNSIHIIIIMVYPAEDSDMNRPSKQTEPVYFEHIDRYTNFVVVCFSLEILRLTEQANHANFRTTTRYWPFSVLGFWDKNHRDLRRRHDIFRPLPGSRHAKLKGGHFVSWF